MGSGHYLSSQARRERTVETVIALCAEADPAAITTDRIAKHMRVTQGALFRHFPNKEAIWEAVAEWVADRVIRRLDEAAADASCPVKALEAMFNAHIAFITEHPGVPRMLMGQLQHDRQTPARRIIHSLLRLYHGRVEARLSEARLSGALRPDLDIDAAATQFLGTIQGLVIQSLIAGDLSSIARRAPGVFDIYLDGLRTDAGAGG
ncbi:TetR/AcrR family transcriptional regulator [Aquibaculum sediminis]|uniref:TetR/AcrR family transcriptional regulator n=1 Tax=Aquibaculum sediminis TaxID=3231907 RepID=UPI0034566F0E